MEPTLTDAVPKQSHLLGCSLISNVSHFQFESLIKTTDERLKLLHTSLSCMRQDDLFEQYTTDKSSKSVSGSSSHSFLLLTSFFCTYFEPCCLCHHWTLLWFVSHRNLAFYKSSNKAGWLQGFLSNPVPRFGQTSKDFKAITARLPCNPVVHCILQLSAAPTHYLLLMTYSQEFSSSWKIQYMFCTSKSECFWYVASERLPLPALLILSSFL